MRSEPFLLDQEPDPEPTPGLVTEHEESGSDRAGHEEYVVVFDRVSIRFDDRPVLEEVSFKLRRGETRILLGPAGVGKSVLLKLANGLLAPDSGTITIFGQDINRMSEHEVFALRSQIGMVFQESALFDSLNVHNNVAYRMNEEHVSQETIDQRVIDVLRFVELEDTLEKFPSELSGGMRRRVAIARAVITKPSLLLYDSPTGGLDPITSTTIVDLIIKQRDASKASSLLVTHRLQDAFQLATHRYEQECKCVTKLPVHEVDPNTSFMMLNDGKLIFDGSTHELIHSQDPFIQEYLS